MNLITMRQLFPTSDRRVTRQIFWMGAILGTQTLGGLLQVYLSVSILGVEGFGILAIIIAVTGLVHGLIAISGDDVVTSMANRAVAEGKPDQASSILRFTMVFSIALSLIAYTIVIGLGVYANEFLGIDEANVNAMLLFGVVGILISLKAESMAMLRLSDCVSLGAAVTAASSLTRISFLALAWFTDGGLIEVVWAYTIGAAVNGVGMFILTVITAHRAGITGLFRSLSIRIPPDAFKFQIGDYGKKSIIVFIDNIDYIIISQFVGASGTGLYRIARQLVDIANRPFLLIHSALLTEYSTQWFANKLVRLRRTVFRFTLLTSILGVLIFGLLALLRQPIINIVSGEDFSESSSLVLIMIPGIAMASIAVFTTLPTATGRIFPSFLSTAAGFVAFIASIMWLTPRHGAAGGAWARTIYYLVVTAAILPFVVSILRQTHPAADTDQPQPERDGLETKEGANGVRWPETT